MLIASGSSIHAMCGFYLLEYKHICDVSHATCIHFKAMSVNAYRLLMSMYVVMFIFMSILVLIFVSHTHIHALMLILMRIPHVRLLNNNNAYTNTHTDAHTRAHSNNAHTHIHMRTSPLLGFRHTCTSLLNQTLFHSQVLFLHAPFLQEHLQ